MLFLKEKGSIGEFFIINTKRILGDIVSYFWRNYKNRRNFPEKYIDNLYKYLVIIFLVK